MVNATSKRVLDVADLPVKNADGSPMLQEDGVTPVTATVFGPGTAIWRNADNAKRRRAIKRTRENGGKYEAALDNDLEEMVDFLTEITKRFNGMQYDELQGDKEIVKAIYSDPLLGYIRDHMEEDTKSWENFTKAQLSLSNSGSASSPG